MSNKMEVMIEGRESLPNITGDIGRPVANGTLSQPFFDMNGQSGAFSRKVLTASGDTHVRDVSVLGTNTNQSRTSHLDASTTPGTGNGVYKENAHVAPNNVVCTYWKRFQ